MPTLLSNVKTMAAISTKHHGHLTPLVFFSAMVVSFCTWFIGGYSVVQINIPQELILRWIRQTHCVRLGGIPDTTVSNFTETKFPLWCTFLPDVSSRLRHNPLLTTIWALIGSSILIGATLAVGIANLLIHRLGFRKIFFISNALCTIGIILSGSIMLAASYEIFIVGRLFIGLGIGFASAASYSYIAQTCPANYRGAMGVMPVILLNFAMLLTVILAFPQLLGTTALWPYITWPLIIPCVIFFAFFPFLPESPRWLYGATQNKEKTTKVLRRLRGNDNVQSDMDQIEDEDRCAQDQGSKVSMIGLFRDGFLRYVLIICIAGVLAQRSTGFAPLSIYSADIFRQCGLSKEVALYGTIALLGVQLLSAVAGALLIDKAGRRLLLLVGLCGCAVTLITIVLFTALFNYDLCTGCAYGSLASVCLFTAFYSFGPASIPFILTAEMFGQSSRESATTIIMIAVQGLTALVVGVFPILQAHLLEWTFAIFAGATIVLTLYLSKVLIETKGRTFLEIQTKLEKRYYAGKRGVESEISNNADDLRPVSSEPISTISQ